jgi:hypothetical protein
VGGRRRERVRRLGDGGRDNNDSNIDNYNDEEDANDNTPFTPPLLPTLLEYLLLFMGICCFCTLVILHGMFVAKSTEGYIPSILSKQQTEEIGACSSGEGERGN